MNKLRRLLCALMVATASLFVGSVVQPVAPVAALSNCSTAGEFYPGGDYAGIICFGSYGTNLVRLKATCTYRSWWVDHYYTRYSAYVRINTWTWVSCDSTSHQFTTIIVQNAQG